MKKLKIVQVSGNLRPEYGGYDPAANEFLRDSGFEGKKGQDGNNNRKTRSVL